MLNVCLRTLIFFTLLMALMRLMGKRQIGELTMSEFVSAILLSELAVLPITDTNVPLLYGIAPVVLIATVEVLISALCRKSSFARRVLEGNPIVLVENGSIIQKNLYAARISADEIEAQIRCEGYTGFSQVSKVTLERTGRMSVLPK